VERWSPEKEDAFREGFKMGMDSDSKPWTVIGFMGAALSGFLVGVVMGVVITLIVR